MLAFLRFVFVKFQLSRLPETARYHAPVHIFPQFRQNYTFISNVTGHACSC